MMTGSNKSPFTPAPDSPYSVCNPRTFDNVIGSLHDIRSLMMYQMIFIVFISLIMMGCTIGKLDVLGEIKTILHDMMNNNAETIKALLSVIEFEYGSEQDSSCDSQCNYAPAPSASEESEETEEDAAEESEEESEEEGQTIGELAAQAVLAAEVPVCAAEVAANESHSSEDIINDVHNN
jgi:hypothetical protein